MMTKASAKRTRIDWRGMWVAAVAIAVGGLLAGVAVVGTVWRLTANPERQLVGHQNLVAFGDEDEPGEYYAKVRIRRGNAIPDNTICLNAKPGDVYLRCFEPSGVSADQTLSEADADAVAEATAERLREDLGDRVQRNEVTVNNFNSATSNRADEEDDDGWWSWWWTGVSGIAALIALAWGFWTGRLELAALRDRLRPGASTASPTGVRNGPE